MTSPTEPPGPVGRLAPSPTGLLHLGHARTFLLAYWHIRSRGGRLLLRLDDLDQARCTPELADAALRDLQWLGLDWDGSPARQTEFLDAYREAANTLLREGRAYPCVCSRLDIQNLQTAPHAEDQEPRYPGTCAGKFTSLEYAERTTSQRAGLRFAVPHAPVTFEDGIAGPQRYDVSGQSGDFLIFRRDKTCAYQLAVVVDDALMGVNEVVRGADLLPSTARQWLLQRSLGKAHPRWFHVPLVLDTAGRRLAKRHDALSLGQLRASGLDPRRLVTWVARSALPLPELAPGDLISVEEVLPWFDLSLLPKEPITLDDASFSQE